MEDGTKEEKLEIDPFLLEFLWESILLKSIFISSPSMVSDSIIFYRCILGELVFFYLVFFSSYFLYLANELKFILIWLVSEGILLMIF